MTFVSVKVHNMNGRPLWHAVNSDHVAYIRDAGDPADNVRVVLTSGETLVASSTEHTYASLVDAFDWAAKQREHT